MPYVKFYSESFMTGVSGLTNEECGMYIKLLCLQHQSGHLDERTICLTCGIKSVSEIPYVMKKFEQDEDGLYFNSRMEVEIQKAEKYVESRIENGKNGGRPKKKDAENNPSENHMDTTTEPYAEPYAEPYENHTDTYRVLDISSSSSSLEEQTIIDELDKDNTNGGEDTTINSNKVIGKKKRCDSIEKINPSVESLIDQTITYFNERCKTRYVLSTEATRKHIRARISEGFKFDDFKFVIDNQLLEWTGTSMQKYIRPETLFNSEKFQGYLNAPDYSKQSVPKFQNKSGRFEQIDFDKIEV